MVGSVKEEDRRKKLKLVCLPPNYLLLNDWRAKNPKWKQWAKERISYLLVFPSSTYSNQRRIALVHSLGCCTLLPIPKDRNFKLLVWSKPESWCYLLLMPTINLVWVWSLFWSWPCLWKSRSCEGESLSYDLGLASKLQSWFLSLYQSRNCLDQILTVVVAYLKPVKIDFLGFLENLQN